MAIFYKILVFIHIFSAIMGMGPGFILSSIVKSAKTMEELRHAYVIKNHVHIYVMIGGTLLLITGLLMAVINPSLFLMGWYVVSLFLFFIGLAMAPMILSPRSKPIKELLASYEGDDIPEEYTQLTKELLFYERIESFIFLVVIALMILKPF